ncbi:PREDICTED: PAX3- and PAX7-binding protein 1-like [Amphimedon queenslandica]|uniref:GCF C-terminal domain-containing protein n=2 Tax=Amphimedon queenslandica TaxID=400682 RepID=A0AAN0JG29_AMPQE|nr:PREDICTED: PAX3- and PAX7-binding protein 1-like [Amphimedon queenslandica]|eukprot:XP_019855914.1 PREDICTED: PAX3- and PAX7-binding protein 1-like [Amphimedon queenslandica]
MASFKKRANKKNAGRNIREKKEWKDDDEEAEPVALTTNRGANPPTQVSSSLLSFDDEVGEGEEFKIKKSSLSKKLRRERELEERKRQEEKLIKEALRDDDDEDDKEEEEGGGEGNGEGSVLDRLHAGIVPDATMIHAIRKKRQLVRERGGGGGGRGLEYMSLDKDDKKAPKAASGKSRLIREDENDKSDEEEEEEEGGSGLTSRHMTFGKKKEPARQLQVLSALENIDSESEDEETQRWEEEQINKGIKASNPLPADEPVTINSLDPLTQSFIYGIDYQQQQYQQQTRAPPPPPVSVKFVPVTFDSLKSRLSNRLQELKDSVANHRRQLDQVMADVKDANDFIEGADTSITRIEEHYLFYQQMKGYLRDLLSCLAIKAPLIKSIEVKVQSIHSKRSRLLITRRRQDVTDESEECRVGVANDEGRQGRIVEREGRRRRRREKRERQEVATDHYEGMSSDDELLETDKIRFNKELESLGPDINDVFSDVVDDFCDLNIIKTRFEQWKFTQSSSYSEAYVSLCLTKIFTPYVRHELIYWNPLEFDAIPIDSMKWLQCLLTYGYHEGEEPDITDNDIHLIPQLIDRVLISKINGFIASVWDPLSSAQTQCLVKTLQYLQEEFPTVSPQTDNFKDLQRSLIKRIQESINEDMYIPLMNKSQLEATNTHSYSFYQRQYWKSMKLLGNTLCCQGLLPDSVLYQLAFDGLVSRYILLSLQHSPINELTVSKTNKLLHILPSDWLKGGTSDNYKGVESLRRFINYLIEKIEMSEQHNKANRLLKEKLLPLQSLFNC